MWYDEAAAGGAKAAVTFVGGHDTDPKDKDRPVVLIAAAMAVKTEVFRDVVRGGKPAEGGNQTEAMWLLCPVTGRQANHSSIECESVLVAGVKHGNC